MDWQIRTDIPFNSAEYFENTLITDNGFREYDVRWLVGKEINPNGYVVLGRAYGTFMRDVLKEDRVVVGYDFRSYSQDLCRSLIMGLLWSGVHVIDVGLALSPMVYFAQHHFGTRGGLMLTASHNENGWTGLKIADGLSSTLGPDGIQQFKSIVKSAQFSTGSGGYESFPDIFDAYARDALGGYEVKNPMTVVVAAGNGTAGRFAPTVLRQMGCDVVEVDCDLNWDFPNHNPNPEDISFLQGIGAAVRKHRARIGLGIDGDGDRIGVVDEGGEEVFSDKVGMLVARWICRQTPGRRIVIDVKSTGLYQSDPVLKEHNMDVQFVKTGHSYVKAAVSHEKAIAGFERSGHWFFKPPYGRGYDDAIRSSVHLIHMLDDSGASLCELMEAIPHTWQSPTLGVHCPDDQKYDVVEQVGAQYAQDQQAGTTIGGKRIKELITVNGTRFVLEDDGWGLVRASSNKPSLVLVAESSTSEDQLYAIMGHIQSRLADTGKVGEYDQQMPQRG